jgi:DNA-binding NtrC family response regulator
MNSEHARRIVVVDDDEEFLEALRDFVEMHGFTAEGFTDPRQALARLRSGPKVCAVLVDFLMRGMDGLSFLEAVRREGIQIPAMLLTGAHPTRLDGDAIAKAGVARVVAKPFNMHEMITMLSEQAEQECP